MRKERHFIGRRAVLTALCMGGLSFAAPLAQGDAAPLYREAVALLPSEGHPDFALLAAVDGEPDSSTVAAFLTRHRKTIMVFRQATDLEDCRDTADGIEGLLGRQRLLVMDARPLMALVHLEVQALRRAGKADEALELLGRCLTFAGHMGLRDDVVVGRLLSAGIAARSIAESGPLLAPASPAALAQFRERARGQSARPSAQQVLANEGKAVVSYLRSMAARPAGEVLTASSPVVQMLAADDSEAERQQTLDVLTPIWTDAQTRTRHIDGLAKAYAVAAEAAAVRDDSAFAAKRAEAGQAKASGLFAARCAPDPMRLRQVLIFEAVVYAQVLAAIDVRLNGAEAIQSHVDPGTGKPLIYREIPGGFEIESGLEGMPPQVRVFRVSKP